ncbi:MAG TPA: M20/M25/M40 family metallo-hydrolase [Gemmatimonadota bacterium]|nr:M20/M25/M40 family metallo-hydrolase [Gemmatimonadota bacterium]
MGPSDSRPSPGLILFFVVAACAVAGDRPQPGDVTGPADALQAAAATITADEMLDRIAFLASDELAGRATPSPGLERAAGYLAAEFERLGLEPGGDGGTFVQRYPLPGSSDGGAPAAPNVVAILRGADPALRETYVVFSAHMDHVGTGPPDAAGDSIYNGADDDASGTAALVEVAEAFASLPDAPARSLLFLAVSGEERGLLGSRWFTEHPPFPLDRLVADLNVDMISRNAPGTIVLIGEEYSSLGPLVRSIATDRPELGLSVLADPWPEERFFFRSDHYSFARQGIPAVFFFAGTHEDYHRPSDEVEKIDPGKAARVARLLFYAAARIAGDADPPQWTPQGLEAIGR